MPSHRDVEFHIDLPNGETKVYRDWGEAAAMAVSVAASGRPVNLDVVVFSVKGARAWQGETGVENYREDPEASVFQRLVVRVDDQGRVP